MLNIAYLKKSICRAHTDSDIQQSVLSLPNTRRAISRSADKLYRRMET